jgi:hypothetical protein
MLVPKNIGRYGRYNVPLLAQGMGLYELHPGWMGLGMEPKSDEPVILDDAQLRDLYIDDTCTLGG